MFGRRAKDPARSEATALVAECEALVEGRSFDEALSHGRRVPAWACVSALAHGTRAELARAAGQSWDHDEPAVAEWRAALSFLAEDILNHVDRTGTDLVTVQRAVLVPLELDLLASGDGHVLQPGQLAIAVMEGVHRHPSRRRAG